MTEEIRVCGVCRKRPAEETGKRCTQCRERNEAGIRKRIAKKGPKGDRLEALGRAAAVTGFAARPAAIGDDEAKLNAIVEELQFSAEQAKRRPVDFFEFAIRDEKHGNDLIACPHQRLVFRFIETFKECVIRTPINTHKSYTVTSWVIWMLGKDPGMRGLAMSATQQLAARAVKMVQDYIEDSKLSGPIRFVFGGLRKTQRVGSEPWRQTEIVVDRPAGIRDPSLKALGADTKNDGPRAEFAIVDDLVNHDNSLTEDGRRTTRDDFWYKVYTRLDPDVGRCVVINTPWDPNDLTYHLEKELKWPTLTMDVYGHVRMSNVPPGFAMDALVPADDKPGWLMLAHLADRPTHERTICDIIYPPEIIEEKKRKNLPHNFARSYLCEPLAEGALRCEWSWIESCARTDINLQKRYAGPNPVYTGIDLAFGEGSESDKTAFVTFELLPDRKRRLLWIEAGQWQGPDVLDRAVDHWKRYGSILCVEENVGQRWMRQFLNLREKGIRIRAHNTSKTNKRNLDFGIESIFDEIRQRQWEFPAYLGPHGIEFDRDLKDLLYDGCTLYRPPPAHVHDSLMALWIGREGCRVGGGGRDPRPRAGSSTVAARAGGF